MNSSLNLRSYLKQKNSMNSPQLFCEWAAKDFSLRGSTQAATNLTFPCHFSWLAFHSSLYSLIFSTHGCSLQSKHKYKKFMFFQLKTKIISKKPSFFQIIFYLNKKKSITRTSPGLLASCTVLSFLSSRYISCIGKNLVPFKEIYGPTASSFFTISKFFFSLKSMSP